MNDSSVSMASASVAGYDDINSPHYHGLDTTQRRSLSPTMGGLIGERRDDPDGGIFDDLIKNLNVEEVTYPHNPHRGLRGISELGQSRPFSAYVPGELASRRYMDEGPFHSGRARKGAQSAGRQRAPYLIGGKLERPQSSLSLFSSSKHATDDPTCSDDCDSSPAPSVFGGGSNLGYGRYGGVPDGTNLSTNTSRGVRQIARGGSAYSRSGSNFVGKYSYESRIEDRYPRLGPTSVVSDLTDTKHLSEAAGILPEAFEALSIAGSEESRPTAGSRFGPTKMASGITRELEVPENDVDLKMYMDKLRSDGVLGPRDKIDIPEWVKETGHFKQCWKNPRVKARQNPVQNHGNLAL